MQVECKFEIQEEKSNGGFVSETLVYYPSGVSLSRPCHSFAFTSFSIFPDCAFFQFNNVSVKFGDVILFLVFSCCVWFPGK